MKITVIGLGYIGLPTSLILANKGLYVVGVDINEKIINSLNDGKLTIEENGLDKYFDKSIKNNNFKASLLPESADVFIIAVPTPNKEDIYKSCDSTYVKSALKSVIPYLKKGNCVIVESTIAPKTMTTVVTPMIEAAGFKIGEDIFLAHCPERVLPGNMIYELKNNSRIIGGMTEVCTEKIINFYKIFVIGELIPTSSEVAELSKLMENAYRDVNIALANELVKVGTELNIDALQVIALANRHPRVNIHSPGPGVGGHCLAVDPYFVSATSPTNTPLIQTARSINESMPLFICNEVEKLMIEATNKKIAALGITYKGNIDDTRLSPAIKIIEELRVRGFDVAIHDQHVSNFKDNLSMSDAIRGSSLVLVLTDHSEYKDLRSQTRNMSRQLILDTKSVVEKYSDEAMYLSLGELNKEMKLKKKNVI